MMSSDTEIMNIVEAYEKIFLKVPIEFINEAWVAFGKKNAARATPDMVDNIMYLLVTYWAFGEELWATFEEYRPYEKLGLTALIYEFSNEIKRRSAANSD